MRGPYCLLFCATFAIISGNHGNDSISQMGAKCRIRSVRRSPGRSHLKVIMLILSDLNMQNSDEQFSAEDSEMP